MKIVEQSVEILSVSPDPLYLIEKAGRTCYKSEINCKTCNGTGILRCSILGNDPFPCPDCVERSTLFIKDLIKRKHESVLEHASITLSFITDRGVTHELVRHRLASFSQESTRFCNYSGNKFGNEITVIAPINISKDEYIEWEQACRNCEIQYFRMLDRGSTPQIARSVLPTCLKTEITVTANIREWRHIFKLRWLGTTGKPHPQIEELMDKTLCKIILHEPAYRVFFADICESKPNAEKINPK